LKKIIITFFAAILLISALNISPQHGQASTKLDQLEKKIKNIEAKERATERAILNNKTVLKNIEVKKAETINDMNFLLNAIQTKLALISEKEKEIAETKDTLTKTTIELDEAEQRVVFRDDLLRSRLRLMYMNGSVSYLDVLFGATSFSDLLNRYQSLSLIVDQDEEILASDMKDKELIALNKQTVESDLKKLEQLYDELEQEKSELQIKEKSKEVMIAQLEHSKEDLMEINEEQEKALIDIATAKSQAKKERDAEKNRVLKPTKGKFAWPLPERFTISSSYGNRIHPITRKKKMHAGIDIAAPKGTKILAAGKGEVIVAKYYGGYGNCVIVDHNGKWTIYGHMSKISVREGDQVDVGSVLGLVGSTGDSTGNHLHYEVRVNSVAVDPLKHTVRP
jgi:murein DD-endopeptidase MepM/ murein hydrolase activator NlpD